MSLVDLPKRIVQEAVPGIEMVMAKFALWFIAFWATVAIVCGVGWYISVTRLADERLKTKNVELQLAVSNGSVSSLKSQYEGIIKTVNDNDAKAWAQREGIIKQIESIDTKDQARLGAEKILMTRTPSANVKNCPIPKDLLDAYNQD